MLPLRRYNVDKEFVRSRTPKGSVCRDDPNGLPQYWCLERILDSRVQCGFSDDGVMAAQQKEYLCKWFGYGEDHSSWESEAALSECTLHVHKYENRHSVAAPAATQLPGTPYHSLAGPSAIGDDVQMEDAQAATDTTTADAGAVRLHDLAGEADRAATEGGADETAAAYGALALESASASSQPHLSFEAPSDESLLPPLQALSGPADEALEETAATDDEAAAPPPEEPPPPPPHAEAEEEEEEEPPPPPPPLPPPPPPPSAPAHDEPFDAAEEPSLRAAFEAATALIDAHDDDDDDVPGALSAAVERCARDGALSAAVERFALALEMQASKAQRKRKRSLQSIRDSLSALSPDNSLSLAREWYQQLQAVEAEGTEAPCVDAQAAATVRKDMATFEAARAASRQLREQAQHALGDLRQVETPAGPAARATKQAMGAKQRAKTALYADEQHRRLLRQLMSR